MFFLFLYNSVEKSLDEAEQIRCFGKGYERGKSHKGFEERKSQNSGEERRTFHKFMLEPGGGATEKWLGSEETRMNSIHWRHCCELIFHRARERRAHLTIAVHLCVYVTHACISQLCLLRPWGQKWLAHP